VFLDHPTVGSHAMSRLGPGVCNLGSGLCDSRHGHGHRKVNGSSSQQAWHRYIGQRLSDGGTLHSAPCTTEHTANLEPLVVP
jgi:hypothetical protein